MNYIVFDLEWNQCPGGKEKENKKLPFEIIQIGAVKLDDQWEEFGQFPGKDPAQGLPQLPPPYPGSPAYGYEGFPQGPAFL